MNKKKKERVPVNARLDKEVVDRLDAFCEKYGYTKTYVMEQAILAYTDKQEEVMRIAAQLADK